MANSFLRIFIKIILTLIISGIMTAVRGSVPSIIIVFVGMGAIFGIWRYKPQQNNNQNNSDPKLKK